MEENKIYKQLEIPTNSAWDRFTIKRYLPTWLNEFIRGCSNLIFWFPTIWKDRNYDDYYIFEILKQKLIRQRKYLVNSNRHEGVWQVNRDITICLNLIERFQNSYYELEYFDYHQSKFEFIPSDFKHNGENCFEMKSELLWENFDKYFYKYRNAYRKMLKENYRGINDRDLEIDNETFALYLSQYNHERCKKLLLKTLEAKLLPLNEVVESQSEVATPVTTTYSKFSSLETGLPSGTVVALANSEDDTKDNYVTIKDHNGFSKIIRDVDVDLFLNLHEGDIIE